MNDQQKSIIKNACNTLLLESESIKNLTHYIDESFTKIVETILASKGRVVVTGIGKSANIANKIVATFNSTGTPALFMHAADAIHGDLGLVQKDDVVICISKSGNSPEIKVLAPLVKKMGNLLVGMVGNMTSFLAQHSDFILNTTVSEEACPNNLAPTSSTTAQLAMGDAVAVCLIKLRGFTSQDFAKYHPGGALGKKLYLQVDDLIKHDLPKVSSTASVTDVIVEISSKRVGATIVVENNTLVGIITDGDLRRMLEKGLSMETTVAADIMSKNPKTIPSSSLAVEAFQMMEMADIMQLIVVDEQLTPQGIIHLHDILKEGIF
ncbi:MAG: arabinose-5-phosphate isomerase [Flavobacteriales bacterium]|jgi:arabinose-5-phosphate isomerase